MERHPIHVAEGANLGPLAFHSSERIKEVIQVLRHCSAPGQVFIRDRRRAHRDDDRPNMLVLPELPGIGPLRRHWPVPVSSGRHQSLSLSYARPAGSTPEARSGL